MNVALIAAVAEQRVIGNNGEIPFKFYTDRVFFRAKTLGNGVLMGRKTYDSLTCFHLEKRANFVLSDDDSLILDGRTLCVRGKPEEVINQIRELNCMRENYRKDLFIIGGGDVYKQFLPYANEMWITEIYGEYKGDTKFPEYDKKDWVQHHNSPLIEENGVEMRFTGYKRR